MCAIVTELLEIRKEIASEVDTIATAWLNQPAPTMDDKIEYAKTYYRALGRLDGIDAALDASVKMSRSVLNLLSKEE